MPRNTSDMINAEIAGIPCLIEVTHYYAGRPMIWGNTMADAEPEEPEEIEYDVRDRKGYQAAWLERKLTDEDRERIAELIRAANEPYDPY